MTLFPRFDKASCAAWSMYERYGIDDTPVSLPYLLKCENLRLLSFEQIKGQELLANIDAFYYGELEGHHIIAYNTDAPWGRVRFSLAHELGHHVLKHYSHPLPAVQMMEQEANRFAAELLCPQPLLHLAQLYNPADISRIFDVSVNCAQVVAERLWRFKPERWPYYTSSFRNQFNHFLAARENEKQKRLSAIAKYYTNFAKEM